MSMEKALAKIIPQLEELERQGIPVVVKPTRVWWSEEAIEANPQAFLRALWCALANGDGTPSERLNWLRVIVYNFYE
jgi:hypothetical protein